MAFSRNQNLQSLRGKVSDEEIMILQILSDEEAIQYLIGRLQEEYCEALDWYLSTLRQREVVTVGFIISLN